MIGIEIIADTTALTKLNAQIDNITESYKYKLHSILASLNDEIIAIAQNETRKFGKVARGKLFRSYYTKLVEADKTFVLSLCNDATATGYGGGYGMPYWRVIERGRRAGARRPPVGHIQDWMKAKGLFAPMRTIRGVSGRFVKGFTERRQAFIVAKRISERGIKPSPELFNLMRMKVFLHVKNRIKTMTVG